MNFKTFSELQSYLKSVPNIRRGGCGICAYFIYQWFKEQGKNPEIAFEYSDFADYHHENDMALKNKSDKAYAPSHAYVKVDGVYYDSDGSHCKESVYDDWVESDEQIVGIEFLRNAIKNKGTWNDKFDRDQELPEMEKKIGINLESM